MQRRDRVRLQDMLAHAEEAMAYLDGIDRAAFLGDRSLHLIIERLLEIVGEAARGVSEGVRREIAIDWRGIVGLRNVVSHQYGSVDHAALFVLVHEDLPAFCQALRRELG